MLDSWRDTGPRCGRPKLQTRTVRATSKITIVADHRSCPDFVREIPAVEQRAVLYATSRNDANRLPRAVPEDTGLTPDRLAVHRIGEAVAAHVGPWAIGVAVEEPALGGAEPPSWLR